MPTYAQMERAALCDLAQRLGPDAPTLCDGWTVRDLMAHLAMRERRPEAIGIMVPQAAEWAERTRRRFALRPFEDLVDLVREGPHELSVFRIPGVDARANLSEYFIHHEDLLRADAGGHREGARRGIPRDEQDALHALLPQMARLVLRSSSLRVAAHTPGRAPIALNTPAKSEGDVVIVGEPSEVLLHLAGRPADVQFEGNPDAINRYVTEPKGF